MANEAQDEFWNGQAGETWVEAQERMDRMLLPVSEAALKLADPRPGERAIDVGCGCGDTSLAIHAKGVAVWGIDLSEQMLARAKKRAEGLSDIAFSKTDAAVQSYTPDHDLVFSRFGVMFFDDPVGAFTNIRQSLKPGGRLVFVCWQMAKHNPWVSLAGRAVQPFLPPPEEPVDPRAPGPFSFGEADYVRSILEEAGYSDITIEPHEPVMHLGDTVDQVMEFQARIGPIARVMAELDDEPRQKALAAVREVFEERLTDDGINLEAAVWLVSAHNS